jgi:hypothetical protein
MAKIPCGKTICKKCHPAVLEGFVIPKLWMSNTFIEEVKKSHHELRTCESGEPISTNPGNKKAASFDL